VDKCMHVRVRSEARGGASGPIQWFFVAAALIRLECVLGHSQE